MSVRRSLAWTFLGQMFFFAVQFGGSVIVARLLTPREMGVFAVAMATIGLVSVIQSFGLINFVVREARIDVPLLESAFTVNAVLCVALALAILAASLPAAYFLHEPGVAQVMALLAAAPLVAILEFRPRAMLQRDMQFAPIAMAQALRAVAGTLTTVSLALLGFSYMSLAWGGLASALVSALVLTVIGRRHVGFALRLAHWRQLATFGVRMTAISGVTTVSARLSELLMGRLLGLAALGLFNRASSLIYLFWENVYNVMTRVLFARLAEEHRATGTLRDAYLRCLAIVTALLWPALLGLAVLSRPIVFHLYGIQWIGAADPLSLLAVAHAILVGLTLTWEVFVIRDETARQARFEYTRSVFGFAAFALGCLASITSAALARVADALFAFLLYRPHLNRMTDTGSDEFHAIYLQSALLSAVAILPACALMWLNDGAYDVPMWQMALAIMLGAGSWLVMLVHGRHPLRDELTRVIRHVLDRPSRGR